ncbi:MAG: T9SS type A sorting domain-containing protein [Bacteroidota bacterium]|nr:T9SS type A sorting domain-containing protein [Bacteroidota bacterium]
MKTQIFFLIVLLFAINTVKSQTASFTYKIENKKVTTFNTSTFTKTNTDSFAAIWYFEGEGNLLFENFDSASYDFFTGGNYRVILTLNHFIKDPINPKDWIRKQDTIQSISSIPVSANNIFNVSGIIKWRGANINKGNVHLLKRNGSNYISVRFSPINGAGNYSFTNLTNDTFIIWVQPIICDTCELNSSNVIPTYYGNSHIIDSAFKIITTSNLTNVNIDLKEPSELNGSLRLTGKVSNGSNFAGNTSLLLYNTDMSKVFRYSVSNNFNGDYTLEKIEAGNYLLQPIINGVPYLPLNVAISSDNSILDINLSTLTTIVKEQQFNRSGLFSIYPNPFTDNININHNNRGKLKSVTVLNLQGQLVFKSEDLELNFIELSELNSGLYFITITDTDGVSNTIRILKK